MGCAAWLAGTSRAHWCCGTFLLPWCGFQDGCGHEGSPAGPSSVWLPSHPQSLTQLSSTAARSAGCQCCVHRVGVPLLCPCSPSLSTAAGGTKLLSEGRTHLRALPAPCTDRNDFLPPWRRFQLCFYWKLLFLPST